MAAGSEVSGEAAVMDTVVKTISEEKTENLENSDSVESDGVTDDGVKDSEKNSPNSKSELQMMEIVDMLNKLKLNPMAKEFFPSSYHQGQIGAQNFVPNNKNLGNDGFPNNRRRRNNYSQSKKRMGGRARAQREDSIRRTVYVSDIDHNITEEQLAALFSSYGLVVDCRVCGDSHSNLRFAFVEFADECFSPVKVLPSKTAILPVNPTFLPRSEDEREMCARTVYCTNIDKKVSRLRLLGDQLHSTRIAFVEFFMVGYFIFN
ncbi:polyadenylate-binding protein-interacting protein 9 [Phtheirospermum japonicum]|uniref:Polyadenylate-binding protein-interacting protein 9 n=1 Tax=Phtheirospermum japonicum TaxID=374723 RepID=A0A830CXC2_9LAMI|nr:polyadenylate-binding protein-interacting protein 9 [Phtheirospermum japonicum]